jgi:hypothetical protein
MTVYWSISTLPGDMATDGRTTCEYPPLRRNMDSNRVTDDHGELKYHDSVWEEIAAHSENGFRVVVPVQKYTV